MAAKITNIIPVQNYAALVSAVGAILATEFAAQLVLAPANTLYSTKIWLERFIAFDRTELPAINIFLNLANYNDNDPHNSRGDVKLSIEVVTSAKHTATAQGDALAVSKLNKLTGAIRYILEHPAYLNLGLQKFVFGTTVESIRNTQPTQQGDGSHTVSAVIIFNVNLRESNGNLTGINLDFTTSKLVIGSSAKGYYLEIVNT
jgi:hypothetical protein